MRPSRMQGDARAALDEFRLGARKRHNGRPNASAQLAAAALHYAAGRFGEALDTCARPAAGGLRGLLPQQQQQEQPP